MLKGKQSGSSKVFQLPLRQTVLLAGFGQREEEREIHMYYLLDVLHVSNTVVCSCNTFIIFIRRHRCHSRFSRKVQLRWWPSKSSLFSRRMTFAANWSFWPANNRKLVAGRAGCQKWLAFDRPAGRTLKWAWTRGSDESNEEAYFIPSNAA